MTPMKGGHERAQAVFGRVGKEYRRPTKAWPFADEAETNWPEPEVPDPIFVLKRQPRKPKYVPFISLTKFITGAHNEVWRDYLPVFGDYTEISREMMTEAAG